MPFRISLQKNVLALKLNQIETSLRAFLEHSGKPILRWLTDPGDDEILDVFINYQLEVASLDEILIETRIPYDTSTDDYSLLIINDLKSGHERAGKSA